MLNTNNGLTVPEGGSGVIDNSKLAASDVDNPDNQIIFTVTGLPVNGQLLKNGVPLSANGTFTQADINANLITYVHNGSETNSDSFTFTLTDSDGGNGGTHTFNITITPVNDPPTVDLNGGNPGTDNTVLYPAPGDASNIISLAPSATLSDPDSTQLTGAVITLTNPFTGDELLIDETAGGSVSGISKSTTGTTITLTGTASLSAYQAVLQTLRFRNTQTFPNLTQRDVTVKVTDSAGADSNLAHVFINIAGGQAPSVDLNGSLPGIDLTVTLPTPRLTPTGTVVNIGSANLTVTDPDSPILSFAQVVLPNRLDGDANEELIVNTSGTGLTAVYTPSTGILQISGPGTVSEFQTVLQTLQYRNKAVVPNASPRTIQVVVNDGYTSSPTATVTVQIPGPALAPQLDLNGPSSGTGYSALFPTPGPGSVLIVDGTQATVTDGDSQGLITLTAFLVSAPDGANEFLSANTTGTGLTATYNSSTRVLTIQGPGTLSEFEQVLRTLRYHNNATFPNLAQRTIQVTASDGYNASNVATAIVNFAGGLPPVVDLNGGASGVNYSVNAQTPGPFNGANALTIVDSSNATVSDPDSTVLVWLRAVLTNRPDGDANERLIVNTTGTGLTATYTPATGELFITAGIPQPVTQFQQVLRTLQYENDTTFPNAAARTIQVTAFDGYSVSATATATVNFLGPAAPSVDLNGISDPGTGFTTTLAAGNTQVNIVDSDLVVLDSDSTHLAFATAQLLSAPDGNNESLDVTANLTGTGITKSYNSFTRTLTLTGVAPKSVYESVLRTLVYRNMQTFPNPATRQIEVRVNDGYSTSVAALATVNIGGTTPPIVDLNGPATGTSFVVPAIQTPGPVTVYIVDTATAFVSDADSPNLNYMDVVLVNRPDGLDEEVTLDANGTSGTSLSVTPTTNGIRIQGVGPQPVNDFVTVLRRLQYTNNRTWPATAPRTIQVTVNDGYSSVSAQATVSFLGALTPSVDLNGADESGSDFAATFDPVTGMVAIVDTSSGSNGLLVNDPDSTHLAQAVVQLINRPDGTSERVDVTIDLTGTGIVKSYDPNTGTLTLLGVAPRSVYQNVLRSLVYQNSQALPTPVTRQITVRVHDGYNFSSAATAQVFIPGPAFPPAVDLNNSSPGINNVASFPATGNSVLIAPTAIVSDSDSVLLRRLEVRITNLLDGNNEFLTADVTGTTISAVFVNGRLVLTGPDTPANFQSVLRTVRYVNTATLPNPDPRTITVFANDGYNNSATATVTVNFPPTRSQDLPGGGKVLYVVGTNGNDVIQIKPGASSTQFRVSVNGVNVGTFNSTLFRWVFAFGLNGNDRIEVDRTLGIKTLLSGGAGNDILQGGKGSDILLGGPGNDQLIGRDGRDLLIGGTGVDSLYGHEVLTQARVGSDEDILIGDSTVYDSDLMALTRILDRWAGSGTYSQRISALLNGVGVPQLNVSKVVFDNAVDQLFGGWDNDWFFRLNNRDSLRDRVGTERIN
ncbi:Leukotoxin [bacterium HR36]|nr:Leukotoxin [bacterium HR36]